MVKMLTKHSESFDAAALRLGRVGFFARGFIWASVGIIAIVAAFTGDKTQGTQGALEVIAENNGGIVFLVLITIGIFCYSSWRFFEGIYGLRMDPDASTFVRVVKGIITPFASGIAYLVFAASNINDIVHGIDSSKGGSSFTSKLTSNVGGKIFLTIISFFLFVTALMWCADLIRRKVLAELERDRVDRYAPVKILVITFAYLGTFGRAILFSLLGVLFLRACYADGLEGGGFGVALQQLQYNTTARIFLVLFGFLIFNFGLYSVCQSFFKKFFPYHPHLLKRHQNRFNKHTSYKEEVKSGVTREVRYEEDLDNQDKKERSTAVHEQMHGKEKEKVTVPPPS